jgi:hypothetical protein
MPIEPHSGLAISIGVEFRSSLTTDHLEYAGLLFVRIKHNRLLDLRSLRLTIRLGEGSNMPKFFKCGGRVTPVCAL